MNGWIEDETTIPDWLAVGRIVLLPRVERDYLPIIGLSTCYELFTGIFENDIYKISTY